MLFQDSLGVSLESDRLSMVLLRGGIRKIRVIARTVFALDSRADLSARLESVEGFLDEFRRENRLASCPFHISVSDEMVMTRIVAYPLSIRENLRATLRYEMEKHVPIPPDDVVFDHQVLEEDRASGRMRVLLVVAKRSLMEDIVRFGKRVRGGISGMEASGTAMANGLAYRKNRNIKMRPSEAMALVESCRNIADTQCDLPEIGSISVEEMAAFGLALRGLRETPFRINLLPLDERRRPGRIGLYVTAILLALCMAGTIAWGGSLLLRERMTARSLETELARLGSEVAGIQDIRERIEEARDRLEAFRSLDRDYRPRVDVLLELTRIFPDTAWIEDISLSERGIQIRGYAVSASELIGLLEASPMFRNVVFLSAIVRSGDGVERFSIGMEMEIEVRDAA